MIAENLSSGKTNVVKIHLTNFDDSLSYEVLIASKSFCTPVCLVDVDNVFFCRNIANFTFNLPCLDKGEYTITIKTKDNPATIVLNQNAII
jgi:hypothetical protein